MFRSLVRKSLWGGGLAAFFVLGCAETPDDPIVPKMGGEHADKVLARVGDREIKVRDLLFKIEKQLPAMQEAQGAQNVKNQASVLKQMTDQYCWVTLAEEEGWDADPNFRAVVELSRKYILANHSSQQAVYSKANPTEAEMLQYYEDNPDQFQTVARATARYILCRDEAHANQTYQRLQQGADFEKIIKSESVDERTRAGGGRLGTLSPASDLKGFPGEYSINRAILEQSEGGFTRPLRTSKGWAIFQANNKVEPGIAPFDAVREMIKEDMFNKSSNELFVKTLADLQDRMNVTVYEDVLAEYLCTLMTDEEILTLAQNERKPERKLAYLRGLQTTYPGSPLAPRAQFLLGFNQIELLRDYDAARASLEEMVSKYPDDALVPSARWMLDNMNQGLEGQPEFEKIRDQFRTTLKAVP